MKRKQKSKRGIGKANWLVYNLGYLALKRKYTKKYNITYDKAIVKDIKGPAIVLATHTSDEDHILSALTLYPIRPTYVVSEHFLHNPKTAGLLKMMHVISKKMFNADVSTIVKMMRAKEENAVIVIFPEGRLSCYGHSLPVTAGTAELIKKLGIDVYAWRADGAYLTFPKWREKGDDRIGRINASVRRLLTAEEVASSDVEQIRRITDEAICHDDELAMEGVEYKCADMTRGLDKILYKCPKCNEEGRLTVGGGHIRCECGLDATLNSNYRFEGAPFTRINEWFEWQQASIDTDTESLYTRARLGCCREDGFMDADAGEGEVYIDKDVFRLSGTLHGEKIEFQTEPEKIVAFPITPGDHIDIYHAGKLIYIYPEPDARASVKWLSYLDNLMQKKRAESAAK